MLACFVLGCAGPSRHDHSHVSAELEKRSGHGIAPESEPRQAEVPGEVSLEDGISEDEAVAIALWNNTAFQEALAQLGLARADLIQAGLLRNPVLSVLFPLGPKQLEFAATLPLETLFLRPARVGAAELDCERVAALLVENGLDLARAVKEADAELDLARVEAGLAAEAAALRNEIAGLYRSRLERGDASELEASNSRTEALQALRESARLEREVVLAAERLRSLLGFGTDPRPLEFKQGAAELVRIEEEAVLVKEAWAARPDLRAAELELEAASKRAGLARWGFLIISGIADANAEGDDGFEMGPGLEVEVPILNQHQGERARADAELKRAARRFVARRDQISLEVKEALARYLQALDGLELGDARILPALEEARRLAEKAYQAGETSRLPVLESGARLIAGRSEQAKLAAGLRRARANLERGVGRRFEAVAAKPPPSSTGME